MSVAETFIQDTFRGFQSTQTLQPFSPETCLDSMSSLLAHLANHFQTRGSAEGFLMPEAHSFLKRYGCSKKEDHAICYLKTSRAYYLSTAGRLCERSLESSMRLGMTARGVSVMLHASAPKVENDSSLLDVLESPQNVPQKYYLSEKALKSLVLHKQRHQAKGNGFGAIIKQPSEKSPTVVTNPNKSSCMYVDESIPKLQRIGHVCNSVNGGGVFDARGKARTLIAGGHQGWQNTGLYHIANVNKGRQREKVYDSKGKSVTLKASPCGLDRGTGLYQIAHLRNNEHGSRIYSPEGKAVTLAAEGGGQGAKTGMYLVGVLNKYGQGQRVFDSNGKASTLTANDYKRPEKYVVPLSDPEKFTKKNGSGLRPDGSPMFTLTALDRHGVIIPSGIRRLMPVECEKLQGFPVGWTDIKHNGKPMPDGQRYKMMGNAVSVPTVEHVLELMGL